MPKTMSEKILARAAGKDEVEAGDIVIANIDVAMTHDLTGPLSVQSFEKIGATKVWDPSKIVIPFDHQVPADSIDSANNHIIMRKFVKEQKIENFYDVNAGVCHQILPDMAMVFAEGNLWFKVPETNRFEITGKLKDNVYAKDVILNIIGQVGADGSTYKACEFAGETVSDMSISDRMVLTNMAIEMGGKTGLVEVDKKTIDYVESRSNKPYKVFKTDLDAPSLNIIDIDVSDLEPQVACPHNVDNVKPVSEVDEEIDQVFLGSCTNGRLSDLRDAAKILKGKKIAKETRMLVIPASKEVYSKALDEGLLKIFVDAGALVSAPCCGPCLGGHMGVLSEGETCISTTNRNFKGRMGDPKSSVYLANSKVVAASAIEGVITNPKDL